tara:strand:- start:184 stop:333 length:150 start_codon:yes stop_codon:yes gene_type:complete
LVEEEEEEVEENEGVREEEEEILRGPADRAEMCRFFKPETAAKSAPPQF